MTEPLPPSTTIPAAKAFNLLDNTDLEKLLAAHQSQLTALPLSATPLDRAVIQLDIASDLLALQRRSEAWQQARQCFEVFVTQHAWQPAVESCDVIYQCEQADAIVALAQGVWLAVSFPIQPQTSVALLQHIIDETPPNADGAAVAAVVAHYIAELRSTPEQRESLMFLTTQMIAQVAKNHSQITSQSQLDFWMERLQLNDPAIFLPRMSKVIDALVEGQWWFDRDRLRRQLPA
ncbi:MAG: hypothetical protein HY080_16540 [Gammaproteobacteria bacterium]|nr:hypothetical protein [Gammaproteobacteria bacterium]